MSRGLGRIQRLVLDAVNKADEFFPQRTKQVAEKVFDTKSPSRPQIVSVNRALHSLEDAGLVFRIVGTATGLDCYQKKISWANREQVNCYEQTRASHLYVLGKVSELLDTDKMTLNDLELLSEKFW